MTHRRFNHRRIGQVLGLLVLSLALLGGNVVSELQELLDA